MSTRKRRKYTSEQRAEAVAVVQGKGLAVAARELGLPMSTLSQWSTLARASTAPPTESAESVADVEQPEPEKPPSKRGPAKIWTPSQKAQILEHAAAHGVTAAAKKFAVSRFSIYDWQRKLARANAGEGTAPTSGPDPADVEKQRDEEVLGEWKKHPGLGPSQVKNQLRRKGIKVSTYTVREVMIAAGYRPPPVKRRAHDRRYEAVRPNQMWHLDFVYRNVNRASTFTLILLDDYTRFVTGFGVADAERADLVLGTFEQAVARHGRPESVLHDRGSAFWSWKGISRFTTLLQEMEIRLVARRISATHRLARDERGLAIRFLATKLAPLK